jgi:hypothetical protein
MRTAIIRNLKKERNLQNAPNIKNAVYKKGQTRLEAQDFLTISEA